MNTDFSPHRSLKMWLHNAELALSILTLSVVLLLTVEDSRCLHYSDHLCTFLAKCVSAVSNSF